MAYLGATIDPNAIAPVQGGGNLCPEGDHEFEIQTTDVSPTAKGDGLVLKATAIGIGADNKDAKIFLNINLQNKSAQAQAIGQAQFSALCHAMGHLSPVEDSESLHFKPFFGRVKHVPAMGKNPATGKYDVPKLRDDGTPFMNAEITKFLFEGMEEVKAPEKPATAPAPAPAAATPAARPAAAAGASRPWK